MKQNKNYIWVIHRRTHQNKGRNYFCSRILSISKCQVTGVSGVCSLTVAWNITADTKSELWIKKEKKEIINPCTSRLNWFVRKPRRLVTQKILRLLGGHSKWKNYQNDKLYMGAPTRLSSRNVDVFTQHVANILCCSNYTTLSFVGDCHCLLLGPTQKNKFHVWVITNDRLLYFQIMAKLTFIR